MRRGQNCNQFLLLYASQKGTAKAIAEDLAEQCEAKGLACELKCCSETDKTFSLQDTRCLVLIGSTTGDGEPPETARKFWRQLNRKGQADNALSHLSYTVLGLGDTNYTNFCNFGKTVDQKLHALGGQRFYPCGWADDGTGLEIVVEPWIEGLYPILKQHLDKATPDKETCNGVVLASDTCNMEQKNANSDNTGVDTIETLPSSNSTTFDSNKYSPGSNEIPSSECITEGKEMESIGHDTNIHLSDGNEKFEDTGSEILRISKKYDMDFLSYDEIQCLSVKSCALPLDAKLSLPVLPSEYLKIKYFDVHEGEASLQTEQCLPSAASGIIKTQLKSVRELTNHKSVKTALEVTLNIPETHSNFHYEPGDSFGIVVQNREEEVELFLSLLDIKSISEKTYELSVDSNTKKKAAAIPKYIPIRGCLKHVFQHCVDVRSVPKKPLVRALVEFTSDPIEKRRLQELVSKEGAKEYVKCVREQGLTLLDLLCIFQSCKPPVTTVLEHIPQLLPRAYSIISSPLVDPKSISFVFSVVDIQKRDAITFSRKGICTGWLASLNKSGEISKLEQSMETLSIKNESAVCIPIYLRINQTFHLSKDISVPIIMIGPGTGVAPFVGFLQHRQMIQLTSPDISLGESWLFYGCRFRDRDYLYQKELEKFRDTQILTKLIVCFSRDDGPPDGPRYVQHNLIRYGAEVSSLITDKGAIIYVCGDARNMSRDVFDTFVSILKVHKSLEEIEARKYMAQMQLEKRYLQDVWA